ncbi:hypothetical protein GUJ93_ZPchr0006g45459 [Zizania palustris]|uniref:RING-CH-type domain-containing protein n=1 Tax=Zizania palustris TaxID=103762 RepID=A0A8J5TB52_ZIZPA|nr:hypothetical protein GUJ93_ZPchr0006g45459 [Zizania palustris]
MIHGPPSLRGPRPSHGVHPPLRRAWQSTIAAETEDVERGDRRVADSNGEEGSQYFSDAEDQSWASHSRHNSTAYDDYISTYASVRASSFDGDLGEEAGEHRRKSSCVSEGSLEDVDLEAGLADIIKASPEKAEKNCRICHLGLESAAPESGASITLGCSCKGDLSYCHKQCAETWFKIRGNKMLRYGLLDDGGEPVLARWRLLLDGRYSGLSCSGSGCSASFRRASKKDSFTAPSI